LVKVEQFIFNIEQLSTSTNEVTATNQSHWVTPGSSVKGFGYGGSPVDHHWFLAFIGDSKSAYVESVIAI
tara:strand:+ start:159 stop:368 length:210 start_codon:yes stop_codon:yes gene_type:complete